MDLLWMILSVFLVCAETEKVTEVRVELGQNITLNCSVNTTNTYWYLEINHSQVKGFISRSYTGDPADSQYYVYTLNSKYSAFGNSLTITNITAEDCRLYYCGRKINNSIQFVDTIHLVSDVAVSLWQKDIITYSSFSLNTFLLVIICLLCSSLCWNKRRRSCNCQMNKPSAVIYDSPDNLVSPQYEEIQLPPYTVPLPADHPEGIYYKAQLRSTLPGS
ncbi:uncharacterized protein LOC113163041 [Anabas testudineus]|uniref:uncharacterized protein LOC113163041 n=1 Tax=Anabas testudineus TaxID=64144 RepID=UPI000E460097|nr:uncharacterized protein LOC113163041 [Anabas testudineus]